MRDRMIELLLKCDKENDVLSCYNERPKIIQAAEILADHLLANGAIVPSVKAGQTVWFPSEYHGRPYPITITHLEIYEEGTIMYDTGGSEWRDTDIGKTIFLTKEEAEEALAERSKE